MRAGLGLNRRVIKKTCPVFFVLILSVCLSYIC
jgi:hypothetical protein